MGWKMTEIIKKFTVKDISSALNFRFLLRGGDRINTFGTEIELAIRFGSLGWPVKICHLKKPACCDSGITWHDARFTLYSTSHKIDGCRQVALAIFCGACEGHDLASGLPEKR